MVRFSTETCLVTLAGIGPFQVYRFGSATRLLKGTSTFFWCILVPEKTFIESLKNIYSKNPRRVFTILISKTPTSRSGGLFFRWGGIPT